MNWRALSLVLLSAAAGATAVFGFAPYGYWLLPLLAVALLYWTLQQAATSKQAALLGFSFGLAMYALGVSWVHVSIARYGGLPLWASIGLMALLASYLALFISATCALWHWLRPSPRFAPLLFTALWLAFEWLRSWLLTGFPWLALGYSQIDSPLAVWAPVLGVDGITAVILLLTLSWLGWLLHRSRLQIICLLLLGLATTALQWPHWTHDEGEPVSVALVQGNIPLITTWEPESLWPIMLKYRDLTRPYYHNELIIWPEAAVPAVEANALDYLYNLDLATHFNNAALITGIVDYQFDSKRYFNNVIVLGRRDADSEPRYYYGHSNRYAKHHLLPIGEFVPLDFLRPLAPLFNLPMSSFSRGAYRQRNLVANGYRLAPALCYEILFAEQVRANTDAETDFLLTVSNDAWFGHSIGPLQHMQIARMRALELGRPLLRATNTGVTALVDANGKIQNQLPQFVEGVLEGKVQRQRGQTPYNHWGSWPLMLFWSLAILLALLQCWRRTKVRAVRG